MHNNWLLGECIKLEQCYDRQWFNCARAATLGNQVCFNLIIMRYLRIARAVVNIQMFIYLYIVMVSVMGDILAKHPVVGQWTWQLYYQHLTHKLPPNHDFRLHFHSDPWFSYILKAKKFAEPLFQSKKIAEKVR